MLTTFFALVFMLVANPALLPGRMKPHSPVLPEGNSRPAAVPNTFWIGPASPDTVETPTRADSLDLGLVDPSTFSRDEFEDQLIRATDRAAREKQFLDEVNGRSTDPKPWT
jgi:hypothetical protein